MKAGAIFALSIALAWNAHGAPATSVAPSGVLTGKEPAWVEPVPWDPASGTPVAGAPAITILSDGQDRLTPDGSDYYYHVVIRLLNAEGVRQNSEWSAVFAPDYETVTWHALKVIRNGQTLDRLPSAEFRKLQRETDLEEQIFTGLITATTVLEDVRVGDILEVAYTTHNSNPLLRGRMTALHVLGSSYPLERQLVICRLPREVPAPAVSVFIPPGTQNLPRALFSTAGLKSAVTDSKTDTEQVYRWEARKVPEVPFDGGIPGAAYPYFPALRFSSFGTWSDVADWAVPLFTQTEPLPEIARTQLEHWKRELKTPEERVAAAVGWVQDDLRYFSMAMGVHNLKPRALAEICSSRFGDCKDKAVLLSRLLNELGIKAWPALVNTYWQERILERGPDPFAFNHAIVAYEWGGETRWLDATIKHQQPIGDRWAVPPYRYGLILRPDENALSEIPPDPQREPDTSCVDHFVIDRETGDATLDTQVVIRGLQADFYRQRMETTSADQLSKNWFNYIARFYKRLDEVEPPVPQDDPKSNQITLKAKYRIAGFMTTNARERSFNTFAYLLRMHLEMPESRRRHWPYAVESDRYVRQRIEVDMPFETPTEQRPQVIATDGIDYRVEESIVGQRFTAVHDLRLTRSYVDAEHMDRFADAVDEIYEAMSVGIHKPTDSGKSDSAKKASSP